MSKQNNSWKGWAIGAVWIGTGLSSLGAGFGVVVVAAFAVIATMMIAEAE